MMNGQSYTVVGVVPDAQYYAAGDVPRPQLFVSYWQPQQADPFLNDSRTLVRAAGDAAAMMPAVRRAVAEIDPAVPMTEDHPLRDRVTYAFQPVRLAQGMLTAFALLALLLSAVGLYGVLAFSVAQRTREIGVRVAVGATRANIASMVLRDAAILMATGLAVGLLAAWGGARLLSNLLFGLDARDATAFLVAPCVLAVVMLAASYFPARRAATVSPVAATRCE